MGLFNNHKDVVENKQTQEIKQATISDTQTNNITQNPNEQQNTQQTSEQTNFINPFTNQNNTTQQNPNQNTDQSFQNTQQAQQQPAQPTQSVNTNPFGINNDNDKTDFLDQENKQAQQQNAEQTLKNNQQQDLILQQNQKQEQLSRNDITEMIDETVEKLIEEKWDTLVDNVTKILKWKETTENQIHMLKDDILNISEGFSKLENKLISKISNYDKDILDVNSEIKALEKVFQKITPTLINNVNELAKIADDFKGIKSKAKRVEEDEEPSKQDN